MQDTEVYIKTEAGRDEIRSRTVGLPMAARAILLMVDGQRSVSVMRTLIAGSKAPPDILDALLAQGLIEPRTGASLPARAVPAAAEGVVEPAAGEAVVEQAAVVAEPPAPPPAAIEVPVPAAPARTEVIARTTLATDPRPRPVPPAAHDGPIDFVLPTIYGPETGDFVPPVRSLPPTPPIEAPLAAPPVLDRYEHLYGMMNEIVRDFLAPHRRYFFQLRIERCRTAEELLELLHALQTSLAKSRGDAFASDVISRLRSAAT